MTSRNYWCCFALAFAFIINTSKTASSTKISYHQPLSTEHFSAHVNDNSEEKEVSAVVFQPRPPKSDSSGSSGGDGDGKRHSFNRRTRKIWPFNVIIAPTIVRYFINTRDGDDFEETSIGAVEKDNNIIVNKPGDVIKGSEIVTGKNIQPADNQLVSAEVKVTGEEDNVVQLDNADEATTLNLEQSPININQFAVSDRFDRLLQPLRFRISPIKAYTLLNNGRGFSLIFYSSNENSISGGPLENAEYRLEKMEVRWGSKDHRGSEHRINGHSYSAEIQIFYYNEAKYGTYDIAATSLGDGLAIVSVFVKLDEENHAFDDIVTNFQNIEYPGQEIELFSPLELSAFLPENLLRFWTYNGSLTQPPYSENVIWIILSEPIKIARHELHAFRKICRSNKREIQPVNNRIIRASFHADGEL